MLDYNELNEDEKRTLRKALGVERISLFYLEDHQVLLMNAKELDLCQVFGHKSVEFLR